MSTNHMSGRRDGVRKSIEISKLGEQASLLSFSGILPLDVPEGTRGLILPDAHIPAHYRPLFWPIMRFAHTFRPDLLISVGDWWDIFALSRHPKPLRVIQNPQAEIDDGRRIWDEMMEVSGAAHGFIVMGNHEDRIYRFLQDFCPQLGGMVSARNREPLLNVHNLAGFSRHDNVTFLYGVEMRGGFEGGIVFNGDFNIHHGIKVRPSPGASPLADMDHWQWSVGHGHTHRKGLVARETNRGVLRAYEFGHLVNPDHSYLSYAKKMFLNWTPGFATFFVHNGVVHVQPFPIQPVEVGGRLKLSFVYDGEIYSESDR